MIALVLGATGYVGRHLVEELVARGIQTYAHLRADSPSLATWSKEFEKLGARCSICAWKSPEILALCQRAAPNVVFACLGTTKSRMRIEPGSSYEHIDYGYTKMILDACKQISPKPRFIYLSSAGTHSKTKNPYLKARARLEADLLQSGLSYAIARPCIITGLDRDQVRPLEFIAGQTADLALTLLKYFGFQKIADRYRSTRPEILGRALIRIGVDSQENRVFESEELR